jgi:NADPH:quinone reductase-like Zn-dependent oxidoreductase
MNYSNKMPESRRVLRKLDATACFNDEPIPAPGSSDVLIRVHAVALNYKDVSIFDGKFPWPTMPNVILGAEFSGEIVSLGEKIRLFKVKNPHIVILQSYY